MTVLDTGTFVKNIFTVQLSTRLSPTGDFGSYAQAIGYNTQTDLPQDPPVPGMSPHNPVMDPAIAKILADVGDQWQATPTYFTKGVCRDTSIGGNDAINCYQQFCENDDISEHPFLSTNPGDPLSGLGRVNSEIYNDQQQIMYITFGVPQYNTLTNFYNSAVLANLATLMNGGDWAGSLGSLIGNTIATFVSLPVLPLPFIARILGKITDVNITKYYDFRSAMPLYYYAVNDMLLHLSINMGLNKDAYLLNNSSQTSGGNISSKTYYEQQAEAIQKNDGTPIQGLPDIFMDNGPDIYKILCKKYKYMSGGWPSGLQSTDDALLNSGSNSVHDVSTSGSFQENFVSSFKSQMYDASLFVGFRIAKADTTETVTNETGESSISQQLNSKLQEARDTAFSMFQGKLDGGGPLDTILNGIKGVISGVAGAFDATSSLQTIIAGAGVIDITEVWKSSSFSKSYHFEMNLRSPYGDPYSIMLNLYIPLVMLLAGGLPRAIGQSSYTAPFVCRAYCKGMFAVPLGMITGMTIKRGSDQFGWNTQRLPTCLDISFEIKDLSPAMYMAISDGGTWTDLKQVFAANSNFQEYLLTLSGMGVLDRISWVRQLRLKAQYLLAQFQSTKLSPFYWGATLGNTLPMKAISHFIPTTQSLISNN